MIKFKRLLTVGLMALFCAGTATAASQLNSVQVMPSANAATVNLHTTGSYAHKEYRPDEHLMLVDLTGVTAVSAVDHTATVNSTALKGYKLSTYTSASGGEVTRIELALGDGVSVSVNDVSDGLKIQLSSGVSSALAPSAPLASVAASTAPASKSALAETTNPSRTAPGQLAAVTSPIPNNASKNAANNVANNDVKVVAKNATTALPAAPIMTRPTPIAHPALPTAAAAVLPPATIRNVSVHSGQGTLDITVEGSNSAHSFLLKNPDRLVLDFSNAVLNPSVRNIAVHTKDVLQVRVGRFQSEPPVIRIVVDLSGPRAFDVVPSDKLLIVRVKTGDAGISSAPLKAAPSPALASAVAPDVAGHTNPGSSQSVHAALASASIPLQAAPLVAKPAADSTSQLRDRQTSEPKAPASDSRAADSKALPAVITAAASTAPKLTAPTVEPAFPNPPAPQKSADTIAVAKPESKATDPSAIGPKAADAKAPSVVTTAVVPTVTAPNVAAPSVEIARLRPPAPEPSLASAVVAKPVAPAQLPNQQIPEPEPTRAATTAIAPKATQPTVELALAEPPAIGPKAPPAVLTAAATTAPKIVQPAVESARPSPPAPEQSASNSAQLPSSGAKYTGEPISVNLKDVDLKDFFRLIHEISGLNVVLDPSVRGNVTLVLDDVPWDQALDIVLKNNALDRELQGNVLRIAATDTLRKEAVDRRAQSEAVALAVDRQTVTRFLSYAKAAEIVPTVKKFLTARGDVISDVRTNALIISDIPSVLPSLDRLISQLDRKSQEVEIEVRVVSATRSFSRDLGVQLGFNWGNGVSTIGGSNPGGIILVHALGTPSTVPLFSNFPATGPTTGFSFSNITASYGIDAILTAAETHNLAKVLSRPRVVTQSNVKAEVKQGVKLPVTTAATQNALATTSYIDSVLRLSVTPQITADNTIFLTVDVENTQPEGTANSNGNFILTTQQTTTQVLVTDGGTVVIGGVIQTTNSVSTTQTPFLGNIPWLGNLFKERLVKNGDRRTDLLHHAKNYSDLVFSSRFPGKAAFFEGPLCPGSMYNHRDGFSRAAEESA